MKIPTNEASSSARVNLGVPQVPASSEAGVAALGHGGMDLARGLGDLSNYIARGNENKLEAGERAKLRDDSDWALRSAEESKNFVNEQMADNNVNTADNFAEQVKKMADLRTEAMVKSAPSKEAARMFQNHMLEFTGRKYEQALYTTEQNKTNNLLSSITDSTQSALSSYRLATQTPNANAIGDLEGSVQAIEKTIEANFGTIAPKIANAKKAELTQQVIQGTMDTDPEYAKQLAKTSRYLDENTRQGLLSEIDRKDNAQKLIDRNSFETSQQNYFAKLRNGDGVGVKKDLSIYRKVLPAGLAEVQKAKDDAQIDTINLTNSALSEVKDKNAETQIKTLSDFSNNIKTKVQEDALGAIHLKINENIKQQAKNPVAWLATNNDAVRMAQERAASSTDSTRLSSIKELNDTVLRYQGTAPRDENGILTVDPVEASRYLNLPTNARHLMDSTSAEKAAAEINQGDPKQVLDRIHNVMLRYPDESHQHIAFNDLVTLPGERGIRQEYQLAFQNQGAWWIDNYLGALKGGEALNKLSDEKKAEVKTALSAHPTWLAFQSSMVGDGWQRGSEIAGFHSGITMYAQSLMAQGKPLKEAVASSIKMLVGESMGFTSVNGQSMMVLRQHQDKEKSHRTDAEISDIGRRLGVSMQYLDPREIDQKNFPVLEGLGKPDDIARLQRLRDMVVQRGFFQTGNDGQSVSLYFHDDTGANFQVTNKAGKPFMIHFDELPQFQHYGLRQPVMASGGPAYMQQNNFGQVPDVKQNSYSLTSETGSRFFGNYQVQTNWPTQPLWIKSDKKSNLPQGPASNATGGYSTPPDDREQDHDSFRNSVISGRTRGY